MTTSRPRAAALTLALLAALALAGCGSSSPTSPAAAPSAPPAASGTATAPATVGSGIDQVNEALKKLTPEQRRALQERVPQTLKAMRACVQEGDDPAALRECMAAHTAK